MNINDIDLIVPLILVVILGGLVGIEREISNHSSGICAFNSRVDYKLAGKQSSISNAH